MPRKAASAVFFDLLAQLSSAMQEANLVLAELSGIDASHRREAQAQLEIIAGNADDHFDALTRALRESYLTPIDRALLYRLAAAMRDCCYELRSVGFALTSSAFEELPAGALEMLALLSNYADNTKRMTQRLPAKFDQWEYTASVHTLSKRALALRQQLSDTVPASRKGSVYLSAAIQLSLTFRDTCDAFQEVGRIVAEIALTES